MNRPVALILAVVVLAHSLAGCCSHHAHAEAVGHSGESSAAATCCTAHAPAADHQHDGGQGASSDSQAPCGESSCVFVSGDGAASVSVTMTLALSGLAVALDIVPTVTMPTGVLAQDATSILPPARLHLLHQILLI